METLSIDKYFEKTYTDKSYQYPTMVRHQGKVLAFAMDDKRQIYYTLLDTDDKKDKTSPLDVNYWSDNPALLVFPAEITQVGYSLIANTPIPTVKEGTLAEVANPMELKPSEVDLLLSTTARLTAAAPFQVLSDGEKVYVFRQSLPNNHNDMVYKLNSGLSSGDLSRTDVSFVTDNNNNVVPLVDNTLLADRFVLTGKYLSRMREVRYRRSRHKTVPHSSKDALGAVDMEQQPFYEPTYELNFIKNLQAGRFTAMLLPTQVAEVKRWQFFAHNSATERIDAFNLERSAEGLFDTRGTQFYTSPDPEYRQSVFEKTPGTCPFTDKPLVRVASDSDHAEHCLHFDGGDDYVAIPALGTAPLEAITLEAWVWLDAAASDVDKRGILAEQDNLSASRLGLYIDQGKLQTGFYHSAWENISETIDFPKNQWVHIAAAYDGHYLHLYRDGQQVAVSGTDLNKPLLRCDNPWVIGRDQQSSGTSQQYWLGKIDEIRIWSEVRIADNIQAHKNQRLLGNEAGLAAYWRLDEGSGGRAYDQTHYARHGELKNGPLWVASTAPIGDSPGMRRGSFSVADRGVVAGMSALLYYQHENLPSGYSGESKPVGKQARVMLAVPSKETIVIKQEQLDALQMLLTDVPQIGKADDGLASDRFGYSVDIDGDRAVVGAYINDPNGMVNAGAVYIFERDGTGNWNQTTKLLASDGAAYDNFGHAVALSGDRIVVGATHRDSNAVTNAGATYIFERDGAVNWNQTTKLLASDGAAYDYFGSSVTLSGDRVVVGATHKDPNAGATYIFEQDGAGNWNQTTKLLASDGVASDRFGYSVALSGDQIVVGAAYSDPNAVTDAGAAYIFERDGAGNWNQTTKLLASDGAASDHFGYSVALSGDRIVVGAAFSDIDGVANAGATYIFERDGTGNWNQTTKLLASDGAAYDYFGYSVALSGDRIVVGAAYSDPNLTSNAGAAYIFERDGAGNWNQVCKLVATDGAVDDSFGRSVALSDNQLIIGVPRLDVNGATDAGGVYFYSADDINNLIQAQTLEAEIAALPASVDPNPYIAVLDLGISREGRLAQIPDTLALPEIDNNISATLEEISTKEQQLADLERQAANSPWIQLGTSEANTIAQNGFNVAADGNRAVIGAPVSNGVAHGMAYIYERDSNGNWTQVTSLTAADGAVDDLFGVRVALSGDRVVVAAAFSNIDGVTRAGAAYLFERDGSGDWTQIAKLVATDGAAYDYFGWDVFITGDRIAVGAFASSPGNVSQAGAVYLFERDGTGNWNQTTKLVASDVTAFDNFGTSVAIFDDYIVIGAMGHDAHGKSNAGAAYLYKRDSASGNWDYATKLQADDGAADDYFGDSVAIFDNYIVIGAWQHDAHGKSGAGAAYIFKRDYDNDNWNQVDKLQAVNGSIDDHFGCSVAIAGNRIIIGAYGYNSNDNIDAGTAYVFKRDTSGYWIQTQQLKATDSRENGRFGMDVAISGDQVIIGAKKGFINNEVNSGVAYFYGPAPQPLADIQALEAELTALKDSIEIESASESLPVLSTDIAGLTVCGSLLKFAYADSAAVLFPRSDGKLSLYFRGVNQQFFAAYYNPNSAQALFGLKNASGNNILHIQARSGGSDMSDTTINVTDGNRVDTCELTVVNTARGISETWQNLPRRADTLAQALNGQAAEAVYVGKLSAAVSGTPTNLSLASGGLNQALPADAKLRVASVEVTTGTAETAKAATNVTIVSTNLQAGADEPVYWLPYDYAQASVVPDHYSLHKGSLLFRAHQVVEIDSIANGTALRVKSGQSGAWTADAPGKTYGFDGINNYLALSADKQQLDSEGDTTLEAWIKPAIDNISSISRVLHHHTANSRYALGLVRGQAMSALTLSGSDYINCGNGIDLANKSFTLECWAKRNDTTGAQSIIGQGSPLTDQAILMGFRSTSHFFVGFWNGALDTTNPYTDTDWHHWAFTYDHNLYQQKIYRDGELVAGPRTTGSHSLSNGDFYIGCRFDESSKFLGSLDEVHVWDHARSQGEIQLTMARSLNGNESGLVAGWRFTDGQAEDFSDNGNNGEVFGSPETATSPLFTFHPFAALGNRVTKTKTAILDNQWQHLAAVYNQAYALQFDGIDDYLEAEDAGPLNVSEDLTLELIIRPDRVDKKQLLIGKGDPNIETDIPYRLLLTEGGGLRFEQQSTLDNGEESLQMLSVDSQLQAGQAYKIAVVRRKRQDMPGAGNAGMDGTNNVTLFNTGSAYIDLEKDTIDNAMRDDFVEGKKERKARRDEKHSGIDLPIEMGGLTDGMMASTLEIEIYIDGRQVGDTMKIDPAEIPNQNRAAVRIGGDEDRHFFQGVISELRLWNRSLSPEKLHQTVQPGDYGLTAWWQLEENEGNIGADGRGNYHAVIRGATWIKDPRPEASGFDFYINGTLQKTETPPTGHPLVTSDWGDEQFTLGAKLNTDGANTDIMDAFAGELEEVRIWQAMRTQEQILDNIFTRLKEDKDKLLAYYTFDDAGDGMVLDGGLRANNLLLGGGNTLPEEVLSTAPVSTDTARVRSALSGVETTFHQSIDSQPAVAEYGDTQYDAEGQFLGVMKRCYAYIDSQGWRLVTGYKVGNLLREWMGQVQFAPQIIGYIEGTPPVPCENMTFGTTGTGVSMVYEGAGAEVTLNQSEEVNYTYGVGNKNSYKGSFEMETKTGLALGLRALLAPMGFGISKKIDASVFATGKTNVESEGSWSTEHSFSSGRNTSKALTVAMSGGFEDSDINNQYNSYVGRLWKADNIGTALVQSETADVYALRLKHNNALVSYSMEPNRDIPRDTNLITFPINPRYVKQGTLDGKIGFKEDGSVCTDEDYPQAVNYGEYSYYKPREAYALKKRIEQERQRLQSEFETYDALPFGGQFAKAVKDKNKFIDGMLGNIAISSALSVVPVLGAVASTANMVAGIGTTAEALASAKKQNELAKKFAQRNLVNTYVWTSGSAFYAESTETTEVSQESFSGDISYTAGFSGGVNAKIDIGVTWEIEANGGTGASIANTKTKSQEAQKALSLDLSANPSGDMQYHNPITGDGEYNADGTPKTVHGRADAYRFMTFYLDTNRDNYNELYNKVVDPIWLQQSNDPYARALRQARNDNKKPACWRVMHRVTFVSRVLPEFSPDAPSSLEKTMKANNINSNWELIKTLEPFVRDKADQPAEFTTAVHNAVDKFLAELSPHKTEIVTYMKLYYGISE